MSARAFISTQMQTNKKKNNLINTLINISILLCDCCKGNDLQFPYAYAYINIHTHVYSHTYTLRIAKIHIQIQKCASFNNKLHNFNLLTHKSATTTPAQRKGTQWNWEARHRPHLPTKRSERSELASTRVWVRARKSWGRHCLPHCVCEQRERLVHCAQSFTQNHFGKSSETVSEWKDFSPQLLLFALYLIDFIIHLFMFLCTSECVYVCMYI